MTITVRDLLESKTIRTTESDVTIEFSNGDKVTISADDRNQSLQVRMMRNLGASMMILPSSSNTIELRPMRER
jgi:hypothetical protein